MAKKKDVEHDDASGTVVPRQIAHAAPSSSPEVDRSVADLQACLARTTTERDTALRAFVDARDRAEALKQDVMRLQRRIQAIETATLDRICDRVNTVLANHDLPRMTREQIATATHEKPSVVIDAIDEVAVDGGWGTQPPPALEPNVPRPRPARAHSTQEYGVARRPTIGFEGLTPASAVAPPASVTERATPARVGRPRDLKFKTQPFGMPSPVTGTDAEPGRGERKR